MTRQNSPKISFQVGCVPIVINTNVVCSGRILLEVREFFWWQSLSIVVVKPVTLKIRIELEFGNTGCWGEGETWESEKKKLSEVQGWRTGQEQGQVLTPIAFNQMRPLRSMWSHSLSEENELIWFLVMSSHFYESWKYSSRQAINNHFRQ